MVCMEHDFLYINSCVTFYFYLKALSRYQVYEKIKEVDRFNKQTEFPDSNLFLCSQLNMLFILFRKIFCSFNISKRTYVKAI
jgi:hypothetical protein